jgi:hypothetical protein
VTKEVLKFPLIHDTRGNLLPVEFSEIPFLPARIFIVGDSPGRVERGGHFAGCTQLIVLVSGKATFRLGFDGESLETLLLQSPGDAVLLNAEDYVRYHLEGADSRIVVLTDKPYKETSEGR